MGFAVRSPRRLLDPEARSLGEHAVVAGDLGRVGVVVEVVKARVLPCARRLLDKEALVEVRDPPHERQVNEAGAQHLLRSDDIALPIVAQEHQLMLQVALRLGPLPPVPQILHLQRQ